MSPYPRARTPVTIYGDGQRPSKAEPAHSKLKLVPSTQYTVLQYTVYSIQYPVRSIQYTVYTVHSTQYTVPSIQYPVYSVLVKSKATVGMPLLSGGNLQYNRRISIYNTNVTNIKTDTDRHTDFIKFK